jgi:hypothetical protein
MDGGRQLARQPTSIEVTNQMRTKLTIVLTTVVLLGLGAPLAAAKPGNGNGNGGSSEAAKLCAEQKQADKAAFKALWGKHAMRDCIRAGRADDEIATAEPEEIHNAAQACRAEREAGPALFAETYGTNPNDRNAFGKCVSTKVHEDSETEAPTA